MANIMIYFFCYIVEAVILWQYTCLFIPKRKASARIIVISVLYAALFAISMLNSMWLNMFAYLIANFIFLKAMFELDVPMAFFHSSILTAVVGMSELAVYGVISYFMPYFLYGGLIERNAVYMLIYTVAAKLIFFTIIYMIVYIIKGENHISGQHDNDFFMLLIVPISSVFAMITIICMTEASSMSLAQSWMITLSAALLLFANLLMFGIYQNIRRKNIDFTNLQLQLEKESEATKYYEMLSLQDENQRIMIHDIRKHLQSIELLGKQEDYPKLNAYVQDLLNSPNLKNTVRLCGNDILNSILSRYACQCQENGISFNADIRNDTLNFVASSDITSIFCNLLDNALEAAVGIPKAFIEISCVKNENTTLNIITIINSCRQNPFRANGSIPTTSKSDKRLHGLGLKSVSKTISKYDGNMQMYFDAESSTVHVIISLKEC